MNGIELNSSSQEFLTPKQVDEKARFKERVKLFFCLLLSNVFIYLMTSSMLAKEKELTTPQAEKKVREHHLRLEIPLKLFLKPNIGKDEPITLSNSRGEVVVDKAYLLTNTPDHENHNNWSLQENQKRYQIEIHHNDIEKLRLKRPDSLHAYPYHHGKKKITSKVNKGSVYEIVF